MRKTKTESNKKYNSSEKGQITQQKWRVENAELIKVKKAIYYIKNKERARKYRVDNAERISVRMHKWRSENREEISKYNQAYSKTEKGREIIHIRDAKKRRRRTEELGFHPISFPLNVPFDWHHVNKNDVVAISRDIHRVISHICGDGKLEGVVG